MTDKQVYRCRVDDAGRIVIPATTRKRFGIDHGDEVIIEADDRAIHIVTVEQAVRDVQAIFAPYRKPGASAVDELLRERREEAARE